MDLREAGRTGAPFPHFTIRDSAPVSARRRVHFYEMRFEKTRLKCKVETIWSISMSTTGNFNLAQFRRKSE